MSTGPYLTGARACRHCVAVEEARRKIGGRAAAAACSGNRSESAIVRAGEIAMVGSIGSRWVHPICLFCSVVQNLVIRVIETLKRYQTFHHMLLRAGSGHSAPLTHSLTHSLTHRVAVLVRLLCWLSEIDCSLHLQIVVFFFECV